MKYLIHLFTITFCLQIQALELSFEAPYDCRENFKHTSYCIVTRPKEWKESEKKLIRKLLEKSPKDLIKQLKNDRGDTLHLYRMGFGQSPVGRILYKQNTETIAWVHHERRWAISLTDNFFAIDKLIEGSDHITFKHYTLVHELGHLLDRSKNSSEKKDFLSLYIWRRAEQVDPLSFISRTRWQMDAIDSDELKGIRESIANYVEQDQLKEAARYAYHQAQKLQLPSIYATQNPSECFAELVASYYLAPEVFSNLPQIVRQWLLAELD